MRMGGKSGHPLASELRFSTMEVHSRPEDVYHKKLAVIKSHWDMLPSTAMMRSIFLKVPAKPNRNCTVNAIHTKKERS